MSKTDDMVPKLEEPAAIWNPTATVNWSIPFTPVFGAWLQMLNWESMGETELAAISKKWFYASLGMLLLYAIAGVALAGNEAGLLLLRVLPLFYLITWYLGSGRPHMKYVQERFGNDYNRRPWKKPLLAASGLTVMYFALHFIVGVLFGSAT